MKEVAKALRKGKKGFGHAIFDRASKLLLTKLARVVVLAGNISPIDVLTHMPGVCAENDVPFIFVPTKEELGAAGLTKRPTSCVMVIPGPQCSYKDKFEECATDIRKVSA